MGGKNRHKVSSLITALKAARRERDRLRREIRELVQYADEETERLQLEKQQLKQEREEFQLRILDLKHQLDHLAWFVAQDAESTLVVKSAPSSSIEPALDGWDDEVDLSGISLALVGGRPHVRQSVIQELCVEHKLKRWVELSPFECVTLRRNRLKAKLRHCHLIVIVTGYMTHQLTEGIYSIRNSGALQGEVVLLNCQGTTGVVREILARAAQLAIGH